MYKPALFKQLVKIANSLDNDGFRDAAEVVDRILRDLVVKNLSMHKKEAELEMTKKWIAYNRVATQVRMLEGRVASLKE